MDDLSHSGSEKQFPWSVYLSFVYRGANWWPVGAPPTFFILNICTTSKLDLMKVSTKFFWRDRGCLGPTGYIFKHRNKVLTCKTQETKKEQRKLKTKHNLCKMGQPFFEVLCVLFFTRCWKQVEFFLEGETTSFHYWLLSQHKHRRMIMLMKSGVYVA